MEREWPEYFTPDVVSSSFGSGVLSSHTIALEAWRRGLRVKLLAPNGRKLELSDGVRTVRFDRSRASSEISRNAYNTVESKYATTASLRAAGVPVPKSQELRTSETTAGALADRAGQLGYPVVLKPSHGSRGRGVFANIQDASQLEECYTHLVDELRVQKVVLERHHSGDDYRIYVVGDKFVAAVRRIPAHVIGDGTRSVSQLIADKNQERRKNPFLASGLIRKDYEVRSMLNRREMTLSSIPAEGAHIQLREKANASAGGDVEDVTELVPEHLREASIRAIAAIPGLPAAAVDVIWNRDPQSEQDNDFVIIELNSRAHIGVNMYPTRGTGRDLPKAIIDHFFPDTPRPQDQKIKTLTFHRPDVLQPLLNGTSSAVELTPLPENRLPLRQEYSISATTAKLPLNQQRLRVAYRRTGVSGRLHTSDDPPRLTVAGDPDSIRQWHERVTHALGEAPMLVGPYDGVICLGFGVRD
ncbi:ATP-grasp domain-containing protein [Nesterenkonia sp. MY13]|uniref:ATP-grasp domain-containing protein n=1 Tax=Nesterenkonia sedimenti TaxID=1463632 RepID=A0A7X8TK49_9MICC|nr:ATP-grasp domain-containing protein [Nesterenkonia sedimenti]NLS10066.1 ATP-grasp domain-containing protein [Nesterenkonia sedimenti]